MRPRFLGVLAAALVVGPAFAGCSGASFTIDLPVWMAGYGWEYEEQETRTSSLSGDAPSNIEDLEEEEGNTVINRTFRMEIFNSTAVSVEGIPIYAAAVLQRFVPDENDTDQQASDFWAAWVYSEQLNFVSPTYVDWRNGEVQLSGADEPAQGGPTATSSSESPTEEPTATEEEGEVADPTRPENEQQRFSWPLTKGRSWRNEETIDALGGELGVFEGRARRLASVTVPAGTFSAVRLEGSLEPYDLSEIQAGIKDSLEGSGADVRKISFDFRVEFDYTYSEAVLNFVDYVETQKVTLAASGRDDSGNFDFTYTQQVRLERRLLKHQLLELVEKPLTFAVDVERGIYSPKPITPASQLAVEILASAQQLNKYSDEKVPFSIRIYNSTAGEKKLRPPESSFPTKGDDNPDYNHEELEVVWSIQNIDARKRFFEFRKEVRDGFTLGGPDFATAGLKQLQATLKLKDTPNLPGQAIFTDSVYFEVYSHTNITYARLPQNATPDQRLRTYFPVEATAARVYVAATIKDQPPQTVCPTPGPDCLQVADAGGRPVQDQRSQEQMKFETTSLSSFSYGSWRFEVSPSYPGETATFEIVVRYRAGV
ncbi:MAG: hypothetical protein HYT80_05285 [Euryarchaeota archaeon]|nr:hypothetical protein [Euryarchaeota archaeon]